MTYRQFIKTLGRRLTAIVVASGLAAANPAAALPVATYAGTSRLATGKWVKIKVTQTGIQEITHEKLRTLGFENPDAVTVYGYGVMPLLASQFSEEQPDDLPPVATLHTDGKLLFYGEGPVRTDLKGSSTISLVRERNPYSRSGFYFLSDVAPTDNPTITEHAAKTVKSTRTSHYTVSLDEPETTNPAFGGTDFFSPNLKSAGNYKSVFRFTDPASSRASVYMAGASAGKTSSNITRQYPSGVSASQIYSVNAPALSDHEIYRYCSATDEITIPTSLNGHDIEITLKAASAASGAWMDYVAVWYQRNNDMTSASQLTMLFHKPVAGESFTLNNAGSAVRVWNVDNPADIRAYGLNTADDNSTRYGTFDRSNASGFTKLVAFDPTRLQLQPEIVGSVTPQDIHGLPVPDLVIVAAAPYMSYAQELADIHRQYQGMTVAVLSQEAVFNEFSSGTPHPMGIRRMAKMFYDRDPQKFKNLLLYGSGSYMNADMVTPEGNCIITFQCEGSSRHIDTQNYTADSYFAMLSDDYDHTRIHFEPMSIGVGRISAPTASEASIANGKVRRYLGDAPARPAAINAILACDKGDRLTFIDDINKINSAIAENADPTMTYTRAYSPMFGQTSDCSDVVAAGLRRGASSFTYAGHGSEMSFGGLWSFTHAMATPYESLPVVVLAACDLYRFDKTLYNAGSGMIFAPEGGCIGLFGSSRTVYQSYNRQLAVAINRAMYAAPGGTTIGEIYRNAHNANIENSAFDKPSCVNAMAYNLGGDPAVSFSRPVTRRARITAVNGQSGARRIGPMTRTTLSGEITDMQGSADPSYNGTVRIYVYDFPQELTASETATLDDGTKETYTRTITFDHDILAETSAKVENGRFETTLIVPQSQREGSLTRLTLYAYSADDNGVAAGQLDNVELKNDPDDQTITEAAAPVFTEIYLNTPEFSSGESVGGNPTLHATITAEAGLNINNSLLTTCRILRDGNVSYPTGRELLTAVPNTKSYSLELPLGEMTDGKHIVELTVTDNLGQTAVKDLMFVVRNTTTGALIVENTPARTDASLRLDHPFADEPQARLLIEDAWGNTVFTADDAIFPFTWDLTDHTGTPVGDGIYSAYAILRHESSLGHTPKAKIVVIR